jgi:hypothetical protein
MRDRGNQPCFVRDPDRYRIEKSQGPSPYLGPVCAGVAAGGPHAFMASEGRQLASGRILRQTSRGPSGEQLDRGPLNEESRSASAAPLPFVSMKKGRLSSSGR